MDLKSIMRGDPFFKNLKIDCVENAFGFANKKILLAAFEEDYLFYGIKVKQVLEKNNTVLALSLDSPVEDGKIFENPLFSSDEIVCVGKIDIINMFRRIFPNRHIYYIPCDIVFYPAFSRSVTVNDCGKEKFIPAEIPAVIIDINIFPKLKLAHVADGFCAVAVSAFWKADYLLLTAANGVEQNDRAIEALDMAQSVLAKINGKNCYEILLICQIWLSYAVYLESRLDYLSDFYVGRNLKKIAESSVSECRFFAAEMLVKLYVRLMAVDTKNNLFYPDYLTSAIKLKELYGNDQSVVCGIDIYDASFISKAYERVKNSGAAKITEELKNKLPSYKKAYLSLYKGKKKRAEYSPDEVVKAITLGGAQAQGYLKILFSDGVLQQLKNL